MNEKQVHDGKIRFAPEGNFWCATAVFEENEEKLQIGRILLGVIAENEEIKNNFIALMRKTFEHMVSSADPENTVVFLDKTKEPNVNQ